jgi:putative pyoverdin transport system ATP-binding/permease protein
MGIVKFFLNYSRRIVVLSLIAAVVSGACNAALLAVINNLLKRGDGPRALLLLGFAGLCLLLPISRYISEILLNDLGQDSLYSLRLRISRQVLATPLRRLEELGTHRVLSVLTDDVPVITNAILLVPLICLNTTIAIGCLVYIGLLSWKLLSLVGFFMVVGILGYQLPVLKAQHIFKQARADADAVLKHVQSMLSGIKELKLHRGRRNAFLSTVLEPAAASFRTNNKKAIRIYTASATWGQTLVFIVVGLIVVIGTGEMNRATLTGCTLALLYMMMPLQVIMNMAPTVARANVAVKNVQQLGFELSLAEEVEVAARDQVVSGLRAGWTLQFNAVTHSYFREGETHDFVLGPLDVVFREGELVFITGGNGSGKTTFAKLLTGLYLPQTGSIELAGASTTHEAANQEKYRQHFAAVFSDCYVFDQLLGLQGVNLHEDAPAYLKKLNLSHKVNIEQGKLSTIDLSQGQRKRLALLTAVMEDRPMFLFDEWAADQDPVFKEIFYLHLLPELKAKGKTVFVISHDDRYYHIADRVVKFDDGHISSDVTKESDNAFTSSVA